MAAGPAAPVPRCPRGSEHSLLHRWRGQPGKGSQGPVVFSEAPSQASRLDNKAIKHLPAAPALRKQNQNLKLTQTKDLRLIQPCPMPR